MITTKKTSRSWQLQLHCIGLMILIPRKVSTIFLELLVLVSGVHEVCLMGLLLVVLFTLALSSEECRFHGASFRFVIALLLSFLSEGGYSDVYLTLPFARLADKLPQCVVLGRFAKTCTQQTR